jgi:ABC-type glycerol-3-phosphate transport system substrate-binding protein
VSSSLTRRELLRAGAGALAALAVGGCGGSVGATEVAVVWSGGELEQFRRVLRGYEGESGRSVLVVSAGDDIDALLRARQRAGTSPDVAILSRPGLIRSYVAEGWLAPMQSRVVDRLPPVWNGLLQFGDSSVYGAWVKAAHKSLFWYLPSLLPETLPTEAPTWEQLVEFVRAQAAGPGPAPLSIGAADGWALTDWLENLLASLDDDPASNLHEALAAGEPRWGSNVVREAFGELARVWSVPGAFPGGGRRALLTQFDASVIQVTDREAVMTCEADFVADVAGRFPPDERDPDGLATFRFPAVTGLQPVVVGGDAAVVLHDSPAGHELVEWLTRPGSFHPWRQHGGFLSPNEDVTVDDYPPGFTRSLVPEIHTPTLQFDLTDRLPGALSGRDGVGSWLVLQDFFADVAVPDPDVTKSIDRAVRRLNEAARRARGEIADAAG